MNIVVLIGVTRANVATLLPIMHERSQRGKVALDDDEVQVKVPPVVVVESISSTVVSFCPQLF